MCTHHAHISVGNDCATFILDSPKYVDTHRVYNKDLYTKLVVLFHHYSRAMWVLWNPAIADEDYEAALSMYESDIEVWALSVIDVDGDSYGNHTHPQMLRRLFPVVMRYLWEEHRVKMGSVSMQSAESCNHVVKFLKQRFSNNLLKTKKDSVLNTFGQVLRQRAYNNLYNTVNTLDEAATKQRCSRCGEHGHKKTNTKVCKMHPEARDSYIHLYNSIKDEDLNLDVLEELTGHRSWKTVINVSLSKKY